MAVNVTVVDQNNVSVNVVPPARNTITIDRGLIGPVGPPGPNTIGGYPINITSAQQYDVLMFGVNQWVNTPQTEITDGGNF